MNSDWSVACCADDPEVVVPWGGEKDAALQLRYIDLRKTPTAIMEIPEAALYPCMAAALRRWNGMGSAMFTAKSDVWTYDAKHFDAEDLPDYAWAQGCYIDLLSRDTFAFSDFAACERQLRAWSSLAGSIEVPAGRCEWTLRPARILDDLQEDPNPLAAKCGFATTLYVWGYGDDRDFASATWAAALRALIEPVFNLRALL